MKKASFKFRAEAYLVDRLVVYLPYIIIYVYISKLIFGNANDGGFITGIIGTFPNTVIFIALIMGILSSEWFNIFIVIVGSMDTIIIITCPFALMFVFMELIYKGRTYGQRGFHLEVVTKDGEQPTFARRVVRNFAKAIGMALYPISLMYYIIRRETPWDTVTKTMVIEKEK